MRPVVLATLALLGLVACRVEEARLPSPVTMTEDAVGHYCQMSLFEHPGPKAQVHLDGVPDPIFFSQVRDAIAYQRMPEQSGIITAVYVNDMGAPGATWEQPGPDNWILADAAFYVEGSSVIGGMGAPELVPFGEEAEATDFAQSNGGRVLRLDQIPDADVLSPVALDGPGASTSDGDADYSERLRALTVRSDS